MSSLRFVRIVGNTDADSIAQSSKCERPCDSIGGSVGGSILIDGGDNNDNGDGNDNDDGMANGNGSWTVFEQLAAWRFLIGIGCGGVYPLAASLSSESQSQTQSQTQSQYPNANPNYLYIGVDQIV